MPWQPTLLEDSLDPWLATEPDPARRRGVVEFLVAVCESAGRIDEAIPVPGTHNPAFAALVPGHDIVIVWIIAEVYDSSPFAISSTSGASSTSAAERAIDESSTGAGWYRPVRAGDTVFRSVRSREGHAGVTLLPRDPR